MKKNPHGCLSIAVRYNRNGLCDWLMTHNKCGAVSLGECLESRNFEAFFSSFSRTKQTILEENGRNLEGMSQELTQLTQQKKE